MSQNNPENLGRRCQVAAWELVKLINLLETGETQRLKQRLVGDILQPADKDPVELDGQLWFQHQCQRCSTAVLRLCSFPDEMMFITGEIDCQTVYGRQVIQNYKKAANEPI